MDNDERDYLRELVDSGILEGPAAGIALQVADCGEESLIGKQGMVFEKHVRKYLDVKCTRCNGEVPSSELSDAFDNYGWCSFCQAMSSNGD
jgi:hypothetical protein